MIIPTPFSLKGISANTFLILLLTFINGSLCKAQTQLPGQIIPFNHQTHAQEFEISCQFCHYYVDRSTNAGVPSLIDCLGCHQLVKGTDETGQFEIRQLEHLHLFKQSLEWSKVNDLPDFVFFSHQSHNNKGFDCEICHGDVASQEPPSQSGLIEELTMQWCMDCHIKKHPLDQNGKVLSQAIENSTLNTLQGTTECHSCHK